MKLILSLILLLTSTFALGVDRTIACDGTDCKVRVYSRVGSTLTESARIEGGGFTTQGAIYATDANKTFTAADNRLQIITGVTAQRDFTLPSTGVKAGEQWKFQNTAGADIQLKASNGNDLNITNGSYQRGVVRTGHIVILALQDTPTTAAHWRVMEVIQSGSYSVTTSGCTGGSTMSGFVANYQRVNNAVSVYGVNGIGTNMFSGCQACQISIPIVRETNSIQAGVGGQATDTGSITPQTQFVINSAGTTGTVNVATCNAGDPSNIDIAVNFSYRLD